MLRDPQGVRQIGTATVSKMVTANTIRHYLSELAKTRVLKLFCL